MLSPTLAKHGPYQRRKHRIHGEAHPNDARVPQQFAKAATTQHAKPRDDVSPAARRYRPVRGPRAVAALLGLAELRHDGVDIPMSGKVLVRQREHEVGGVAIRGQGMARRCEKRLETFVAVTEVHDATARHERDPVQGLPRGVGRLVEGEDHSDLRLLRHGLDLLEHGQR